MKKNAIILFFITLIISNILLIINDKQKSKLILNMHNTNNKLTTEIYDHKKYVEENIRLTNINANKLKDLLESSTNQNISYIIMIPSGACSGCIADLLEERYINDLPKKQTYIISEYPNDWLKKELKGNKFHNYYCDTTFFQNFEFKENIVIAKYLSTYQQLYYISYIPKYSTFVKYFLQ